MNPPAAVLVQPRLWSQSATIRFNGALLVGCVAGLVWSRNRAVSACLAAGVCVALGNLALRIRTTGPLRVQIGGVDFTAPTSVYGPVVGHDLTGAGPPDP